MLEKQIQTDILNAMKSSDKFKVSVLRMLKSALQNEKINSKKQELTDTDVLLVIKKQVKLRKDSLAEYEKYNRTDLADGVKQEIEILNSYLPAELSLEEIQTKLDEILSHYENPTMKDMGSIMKEATATFGAQADASLVSKLVREKLMK